MPRRPGTIGKRRREQIIEAAVAIIAEQGLQHLSLSAIEQRAAMSRGQLTYYFPAKEDILLAVFDHMLETMHRKTAANEGPPGCPFEGLQGWQRLQSFLTFMILHPPDVPEFHALQYTFLSQVGHREDFRERLAQLYEYWRTHMAGDFAQELPSSTVTPAVSPRTLASFVQALLHGLAIQRAADPEAYDREEMLRLCLYLLANYLGKRDPVPTKPLVSRNGSKSTRGRARRPSQETRHG